MRGGASAISFTDAVNDFIAAMESCGVKPIEPVAGRLSSGELIRFRCDGDGKGRQNGWAILYLDARPAGAFGNYRLGVDKKWKIGDDRTLSDAERRELREEVSRTQRQRAEERARTEEQASRDASDIWGAGRPAPTDHPYLLKKQIGPEGLRIAQDGRLLIPMYDPSGSVRNLQRIAADGSKRFLKGARTSGLFCTIGQFTRRGERTCIGEGYATLYSIHRAAGYPCVVTFSSGNLLTIAKTWWSRRPDLEFIVCGDDDCHLERNIGREAAMAAAQEIGARFAFPEERH